MTDEQRVAEWMGRWIAPQGEIQLDVAPLGSSLDCWPPVFVELERRGLWFEFTTQLLYDVNGDPSEPTRDDYWKLIKATPAQRLKALVGPFILRGVTLAGVNSVTVPRDRRVEAWQRLADDLDLTKLDAMTSVVPLGDVVRVAHEILDGKVRGRVVVDVNA